MTLFLSIGQQNLEAVGGKKDVRSSVAAHSTWTECFSMVLLS